MAIALGFVHLLAVFFANPARAENFDRPTPSDEDAAVASPATVAANVPRVAYTDSAFGTTAFSLGAAGFGEGRGSANAAQQPHFGGGLRLWGAPIDRLLLVLDAQRRDSNDAFAPSFGAQLRVLGSRSQGFALGILGRYKTEGFANLEGEVEGGILVSLSQADLHLDGNLIVGGDFDGREGDGEVLARAGYDVVPYFRVGAEGRGRYKLAGATELPGNRVWDAFFGPQLFVFGDHYFGALTMGPSTVGIADRLGWSAIASAGGVMF